jgi:hypothetical protein
MAYINPRFLQGEYSVSYLVHTGVLLGLSFDREGGDMFLRNVR